MEKSSKLQREVGVVQSSAATLLWLVPSNAKGTALRDRLKETADLLACFNQGWSVSRRLPMFSSGGEEEEELWGQTAAARHRESADSTRVERKAVPLAAILFASFHHLPMFQRA